MGSSGASTEGIFWVTRTPIGQCQVQERMLSGAHGDFPALLQLWDWSPSQRSTVFFTAVVTLESINLNSTPCGCVCETNPSDNKCFKNRNSGSAGKLSNLGTVLLFCALVPRRPVSDQYPQCLFMLSSCCLDVWVSALTTLSL